MKNIWNKIYIHPITYFFILSGLLTGYFNMLIALILIIVIHETGHILLAIKFGYNVKKIEFYPFGGITRLDKDINSSIKEEILISISGIFLQVILGFIMIILYNLSLIRLEFYTIFKLYNITILIFNLLPIIPLDGHIFIKSLLELFFSFRMSYYFSVLISLLGLVVFIWINIVLGLNNYIILSFLIYKLWESLKKFKYVETRFYLERFLHNYNYPRVKIIEGINLSKMYKEKTHYFLDKGIFINEADVLKQKFDKRRLI